MAASQIPAVTLANCEDEPIHLPSGIQPHGALVALDTEGRVLSCSSNFAELMGFVPAPRALLNPAQVGQAVIDMLAEGLHMPDAWVDSLECRLGEQMMDVIGHSHLDVYYLEFEPRLVEGTSFSQLAVYAQRIISQMRVRLDIDSLIARVTDEIRQLTGYDRVMAYRFRADLSGEVIAEARRPDLGSYLGQRYPASDIPAQARLLYILNPIRLIAHVAYTPATLVPALNPSTGQPFDLSFSTLRSVSPIHCEYLTNMGVQASMSVSIVVEGKLWGLFACHHMSPKTMPHPLRMSFQVISQICSALVERLEHHQATQLLHEASLLQQQLVARARDSEDLVAALGNDSLNIAQILPCDGAAVVLAGRTISINGQFDTISRQVTDFLESRSEDFYQTDQWLHGCLNSGDITYCGVLAIRFHPQESGWIIWFRREEIDHVKWAGKPEKTTKVGPSGPRLTPRGSFDAWEEVVRGRSPDWTRTENTVAQKLRSALVELCLSRASEVNGMRQRLIAMLGHDLRNPLQSISMAAAMLSSSEIRDTELRKHISHSSGRMERLINQVLEMSRLQSGLGIMVRRADNDLSALVQSIVEETRVAFPALKVDLDLQPDVQALVDPDRYAQIITNLLGNARHHGKPGHAIKVSLTQTKELSQLAVTNKTTPLAPEQLATLFLPFKPAMQDNPQNRNGLGIGLYISQAIATAHNGQITVIQDSEAITFSMVLPNAT